MTNLRNLVLAAVIAVPLALYAQPIEKPEAPNQKATANAAGTNHQPTGVKHVLRAIAHDLNPITWFLYLSQPKPYCTYAYSQAYGACEGSRSR